MIDLSYKSHTLAFIDEENLNWVIDSSAKFHLTPNIEQIQHPRPYYGNQILVGNGELLQIHNTSQGSQCP